MPIHGQHSGSFPCMGLWCLMEEKDVHNDMHASQTGFSSRTPLVIREVGPLQSGPCHCTGTVWPGLN